MAGMPLTDPSAPDLSQVAQAPAATLGAAMGAFRQATSAPTGVPVSPVASGSVAPVPAQPLIAAKQASQQNVADTLTDALGATAAAHRMQAHVAAGQYAAALGDEANITGRAIGGAVALPFAAAAKLGAYTYDNVATPIGHGLVDFARGAAGLDPVNWSAPPAQVATPRAPVGASAAPLGAPAGAQPASVVGTSQDPVVQRGLAIEAARANASATPTIPVPPGYVLTNAGYAPAQPAVADAAAQRAAYAAGDTARVPDLPGVNYAVPAQVASPRPAAAVSPAVAALPGYTAADMDTLRNTLPRDRAKVEAQIQQARSAAIDNTIRGSQVQAIQADYARNMALAQAQFKPGTPQFEAAANSARLRTVQQLGLLSNPNQGVPTQGLFQNVP